MKKNLYILCIITMSGMISAEDVTYQKGNPFEGNPASFDARRTTLINELEDAKAELAHTMHETQPSQEEIETWQTEIADLQTQLNDLDNQQYGNS